MLTPEEARQRFHELHPPLGKKGGAEDLAKFLEELLEAPDLVNCYTTTEQNPSRNLKNKLSQGGTGTRNSLVTISVGSKEIHDALVGALENRWATNKNWSKTVSGVGVVYQQDSRWTLATIVEWRPSRFPAMVRERLFPNLEVVGAKGGETGSGLHGSLEELAASLFVPEEWLRDVVWMLDDKKGVILYGPPGTGKTYIALKLAEHLQPDEQHRVLVQFHPTYGYEEFFEGYRPVSTKGAGLALDKTPGPLRRLAVNATKEDPAFLVIDEINRGNLPRIFGELYFLLEYRGESASLLYSPDEKFSLPDALYIIGTMNTADRSIALLDQALRRRFHFVGLFPGKPVVDGMLRGFLSAHCPDMVWLADLLDRANKILGDPNIAIGPSHFMRKHIDESTARRVWEYSVIPSIAEHFFGDEGQLEQFGFDVLAKATRGQSDEAEDGDASGVDDESEHSPDSD